MGRNGDLATNNEEKFMRQHGDLAVKLAALMRYQRDIERVKLPKIIQVLKNDHFKTPTVTW